MSPALRDLVEPATTAVLTMELQEGVVGASGPFPELTREVTRTGIVDVARRVCTSARDAGARVVHCTAISRADGAGSARNARMLAYADKLRRERGASHIEEGSRGAALVDGLLDERDLVVPRLHGVTPFTSTSLDQLLRNLGVRTVVATGVSLNVGVLGLVLTAVDLGYQTVVVRDAVAGIPAEYGHAVLDHSLSMLATIVDADDLLAAWSALTNTDQGGTP